MLNRLREKTILLPIVGALLYLGLLTTGLFQKDHGIFVSMQLKQECDQLTDEIKRIENDNQLLRSQWERLKFDSRYIEKIAREDLYMVGDRELLFLFQEDPIFAAQ